MDHRPDLPIPAVPSISHDPPLQKRPTIANRGDPYFHRLSEPEPEQPTEDAEGEDGIVYTSALSLPVTDARDLQEYIPVQTPNDEIETTYTTTPSPWMPKEEIEATYKSKASTWSTTNTDDEKPSSTPPPSIPFLPLDLRQHKIAIACRWIPIIFSSGLLPIICYLSLPKTTNLEVRYIITIPLSLTALTTLISLSQRIWSLAKSNSQTRPLGLSTSNQDFLTLDYFTWNYIFGSVLVTALMSTGIGLENVRIVSLPLSILILYICAEMIWAELCIWRNWKAPFRMSSIAPGEELRPAVYILVEDVVAVEGGMGRKWREVWVGRYTVDEEMRNLLKGMDWIWGLSGLVVVAAVWGIVFGVRNSEVGFVVGWVLPWVWAGAMTVITIGRAKATLSRKRYGAGAKGQNAA